ncbi:hypothetical protein TruAng_004556 [Truncatella angustata]|nr:hypothetical protein TruAng_004556 [Truncatella angustata]
MDFINWDAAGADTGFDFQAPAEGALDSTDEAANMNMVLGDVDGDNFSFWALEHFDSTQIPQDLPMTTLDDTFGPLPLADMEPPAQLTWEFPEAPCGHCRVGGYECKRIREGNHAGSVANGTFPANPWPTMGDRPETSILHEDELAALTNRTVDVTHLESLAETETQYPSSKPAAKIGARFSRESVRILKNWVSTHSRHPYPTEEEKESLQKITGLNKTQITNWLANARRRGKIQPTRSISPHVGAGYAQAMDIPQRRGTPRLLEHMNPLQRWASSPPENEPASVTAIARAVTASSSAVSSSSGRNSPYVSGYSDDGSSRSICQQSSASSFTNSHGSSGGSFASSFSHQSRGSFGSIPSFIRSNRGRRRRRRAPPKRAEEGLTQPLKTFQCTFCTETFRTKHDWQRHEKSLHLSLERWVCSPDGPTALNPGNGLISCVFCGEANPDETHIESHNFSGCTERTMEERTFYRKDHLRQHLNLVHDVKFLPWAMDTWKANSPAIRSRCGFCGTVMDSWSARIDHLAEHFKSGNTMADWKGDWGFDTPVLQMVENSMPPYLIHEERTTPLPYMATVANPSTPTNAYELLKFELQYWAHSIYEDTGRSPTDDETQQEACRIIFGAEVISQNPAHLSPSWIRDIMKGRTDLTQAAMHQPIRRQAENRLHTLRINGKDNIFESCEFESQLQDFVKARQLLGLTAMDHELQTEACKIIGRLEEKSANPSEDIANWVVRLIHCSTTWLTDFRRRAHLPRTEDIVDADVRCKDPTLIDSTIHNYSRLDRELGEFLQTQRSMGIEPTDALLQRQARLIIYDNDDDWNQTAADDTAWLESFKQRYQSSDTPMTTSTSSTSPKTHRPQALTVVNPCTGAYGPTVMPTSFAIPPRPLRPGPYFLNDANCYQRLAKDLGRFVASTMSANNPNSHVPSDEELQHQARWIVYDDDDPWNQTAADNAEWLQRFKRDVGILQPESGPGLTTDMLPWNHTDGGTGFAPPYVHLSPQITIEPLKENPKIFCRDNAKPFEPDVAVANRFLQSLNHRYAAPAKVFCSRELENGLTEYVKREVSMTGIIPSDDELRERAKQIMSMQKTAAEDPILLEKFRSAMQQLMSSQSTVLIADATKTTMPPPSTKKASSILTGESTLAALIDPMPLDTELNLSDEQVNDILDDLDFSL